MSSDFLFFFFSFFGLIVIKTSENVIWMKDQWRGFFCLSFSSSSIMLYLLLFFRSLYFSLLYPLLWILTFPFLCYFFFFSPPFFLLKWKPMSYFLAVSLHFGSKQPLSSFKTWNAYQSCKTIAASCHSSR